MDRLVCVVSDVKTILPIRTPCKVRGASSNTIFSSRLASGQYTTLTFH